MISFNCLTVTNCNSLDIKMVFMDGLLNLKKKVQDRFYTTAMCFAHDLCNVFHSGVVTQPSPDSEIVLSSEIKKPVVMDIKERKKLGKRIVKAIQPQLQMAVRAEADINGKSADDLLKELDQLLDASVQPTGDTISVSVGDSHSLADADARHERDVEMASGVEHSSHGNESAEGSRKQSINGSEDVEMQDTDAPGEEVDEGIGSTEEASDKALAEVDGNVSQTKAEQVNGIKNANKPDTNGAAKPQQPPTPPLSNGDASTDQSDPLANGGIPWYLKEFHPEGTSIVQERGTGKDAVSQLSEDLSDMDDEALKGLGIDVDESGDAIVAAVAGIPKPKKAKAKKKKSRR
jgi:NuA3 HAT complex component NTO1